MNPVRFRASVGHVADFVHAAGDLGGRGGPMVRPIEGLRRQQAHQAEQRGHYLREVTLDGNWEEGALELLLAGRADGIDLSAPIPVVEEIKTYRGDLDGLRAQRGNVHDAQVALYAALFARRSDAASLRTRVRYLEADSEVVSDVERIWSRSELETFFDATCRAYAGWLVGAAERRRARDVSLTALTFPHGAFRSGQRALAGAVWQVLGTGEPLLAEAPTGIGKTVAVLYGALRRLPEIDASRLMYLTARGPGRSSALQAIAQLDAEGAVLRTLDMRARDSLCFLPGTPCNGSACPYAQGYYDRRRAALSELLAAEDSQHSCVIDAERTRRVAGAHRVCPAALQSDAARWSDVVIADMNHGLDPFARQRALLDPEEGGAAVLIDEAHNLEDRARDMFSAALESDALRNLGVDLRGSAGTLGKGLERLARQLEMCQSAPALADLTALTGQLERLLSELGDWLGRAPAGGLFARCRGTYGSLLRWWTVWREAQATPDAWRVTLDRCDPGSTRMALRCLTPAASLAREHVRWRGLVLFSATLAPSEHLIRVLGLPQRTRTLRLGNPFPPSHQQVLLVSDLDLRHRARTASTPALARLIIDLARARPGHHLVFVPSFAFLRTLSAAVVERAEAVLPDMTCLCQRPEMDEAGRRDFLDSLSRPDGRTRIAFAIAGGVFGEGVDLVGDRLVGVVVAGLPMPPPDVERRAIRDYHGADGFDIAFRIPAITRLLQAAGRLIRSEKDVGTLCLVDCRLAQPGYRRLLRPEWVVSETVCTGVGEAVTAFWTHHPAMNERRDQHAQDQDHLHHRPCNRQLSDARAPLPGRNERGPVEHVPRGSCVRHQGDQLDPDAEPEGPLSGTHPAGYAGPGDPYR